MLIPPQNNNSNDPKAIISLDVCHAWIASHDIDTYYRYDKSNLPTNIQTIFNVVFQNAFI